MNKGLCLVVGMHRSGTSMICRCLAAFGVAHGENLHVNFDNAKGHWEDLDLIALNESLLAKLGRHWASLLPASPQLVMDQLPVDAQTTARALVKNRLAAHPLYAFKDPRTTVLLPFWIPVLQAMPTPLRIVLCLRHPSAVCRSLAQRDGFHHLRGLVLWLQYNLGAIAALSNLPIDLAVVEYEQMLANPRHELNRLGAALQLSLDEAALANLLDTFIDPSLDHHGDNDGSVESEPIWDLALEVHAHLCEKARTGARLENDSLQQVVLWRQRLAPLLALAPVCDDDYVKLRTATETAQVASATAQLATEELAVVYRTISWRLTRPLRWLRTAAQSLEAR